MVGNNGTPPYVYYINSPGAIDSITGHAIVQSQGVYTVTVVDASNCIATNTVSCFYAPTLNIQFIANCLGLPCNANCYLNTYGGATPYTYNIQGGGTINMNGVASNLCAGNNYTVYVEDANLCIDSISFTVPIIAPMMITTSIITPAMCNPPCMGKVLLNITGGTPPYFIISPLPNIVDTIINLCIGQQYLITVSDANGCSMSTYIGSLGNFNSVQNQITNNVICNAPCTGSGFVTPVGGVPPFIYSISPTGIIDSLGNYSNVCSGYYTVTAIDSLNCQVQSLYSMPSNLNIQATVGIGSIVANPTNGTPPYEYSLNGGIYTLNNSFSYLCKGNYILSVKDASVPPCIKDTVLQITLANLNFAGGTVASNITQSTCNLTQDGSINLFITPPNTYTYLWSNNTTNNPLVNVGQGSYSVTIKNPAGDCVQRTYNLPTQGINCGYISGNVFLDSNNNCIQDIAEINLENLNIFLTPLNLSVLTNSNGYYTFNGVPYGNYTITNMGYQGYYVPNCANNIPININAINNNITQNFSDTASYHIDYIVYLNNPSCFFVANPSKQKKLKYRYQGVHPLQNHTATLYAVFDSINHFQSSIPAPSYFNGDTVFWNVNNVSTNIEEIIINFTFPLNYTDVNTAPFSYGIINMQFYDMYLNNNLSNITFDYCNGWDPNNKLCVPKEDFPGGYINYYDSLNQFITYYINFQNTGNAPAFNITIEDAISDKLDINSLTMLHTTHNYTLEVINGYLLRWKFNNIMLPDSNSDPLGSQGQIIYQIKQAANNQIGDEIKNKAYIFFDYNIPIETNETKHILIAPNSLNEVTKNDNIYIYPNPTQNIVHMNSKNNIGCVQVYDMQMKLLYKNDFGNKQSVSFSTAMLNNGVYIIKINEHYVYKLIIDK